MKSQIESKSCQKIQEVQGYGPVGSSKPTQVTGNEPTDVVLVRAETLVYLPL